MRRNFWDKLNCKHFGGRFNHGESVSRALITIPRVSGLSKLGTRSSLGNRSPSRFLVDVVLSQTRDRLINEQQIPERGFSITYCNGANPKDLGVMGCEANRPKYPMDLGP